MMAHNEDKRGLAKQDNGLPTGRCAFKKRKKRCQPPWIAGGLHVPPMCSYFFHFRHKQPPKVLHMALKEGREKEQGGRPPKSSKTC